MKKAVILSALLSLTLLAGCGSSAAKSSEESSDSKRLVKYELQGNSDVSIKDLDTSKTSTMESDWTVSCDPDENVSYITLKTGKGSNTLYIEKDHFLIKDGDKYDDMTQAFQDSGFRYVFSLGADLAYDNSYLSVANYASLTPSSETKSTKKINGTTYNGTEKVYEGDEILSDVFKTEAENVLNKRNESNTLSVLKAASSDTPLTDKQKQAKIDELEKQYKKKNSNALSVVTVKDVKITIFQDNDGNILSSEAEATVNLNDAYEMTFSSKYDITGLGNSVNVPLIDEKDISTLSGDVRTALTSSFE